MDEVDKIMDNLPPPRSRFRTKLTGGLCIGTLIMACMANFQGGGYAEPQMAASSSIYSSLFGTTESEVKAAETKEPKRLSKQKKIQAEKLVVVTMPDALCEWCKKLKVELKKLEKKGYEVDTIFRAQYKLKKRMPKVKVYPTIFFVEKGKYVAQYDGFQTAETIEYFMKPLKALKNGPAP